jgi:hypothetical protein
LKQKDWTVKEYKVHVDALYEKIKDLERTIMGMGDTIIQRDATIRAQLHTIAGHEQLRERDRGAFKVIELAVQHMSSYGEKR